MKNLAKLQIIGKTLAEKLVMIGVKDEKELKAIDSENAVLKLR